VLLWYSWSISLRFSDLLHRQSAGWDRSEPVFVNLLRSPVIDSQPCGTVRQFYLSYRPARLHRLAESTSRNQFLGSINVYKYRLRRKLCFIDRNEGITDSQERWKRWRKYRSSGLEINRSAAAGRSHMQWILLEHFGRFASKETDLVMFPFAAWDK
jgi:hypothetical protein